jgi:hypothetical protein
MAMLKAKLKKMAKVNLQESEQALARRVASHCRENRADHDPNFQACTISSTHSRKHISLM